MSKIINFLDKIVAKHKDKNKEVLICKSPVTRNRNKKNSYIIPFDKPQCPIFKDNRCCGGCRLSINCRYSVDCGCYGFTHSALGISHKNVYLRKSSKTSYGRINKEYKFDWEYYNHIKKTQNKKLICRFCKGTGVVPSKKYSIVASWGKLYEGKENVCGICSGSGEINKL